MYTFIKCHSNFFLGGGGGGRGGGHVYIYTSFPLNFLGMIRYRPCATFVGNQFALRIVTMV